ncbi:MAG TPA: hypothetical protein VF173_12875 [Thermoanaerobaculia bacterium]|nr:hypothetical protein [Thermoanaerobaculia bacterium]
MSSNRRWLVPCFAAVMIVAALPALAQVGPTPAGPPQRVPGPLFCSQIVTDDIHDEVCSAVFMACINGYDTSAWSVQECPGLPGSICVCYNVELFPPPSQTSCYANYEACLGIGNNQIPPSPAP